MAQHMNRFQHLAALRPIPGLTVIRPTDANETASAWAYALQQTEGPVAINPNPTKFTGV